MDVRPAEDADLEGIAAVAEVVGQGGEGNGGDRRYLEHLRSAGRLVVAEVSGVVAGYAASVRVGLADTLSDLFVHPAHRGEGVARGLLDSVWSGAPKRQTFSSLHPSALPLYAGVGLTARWPLLYVSGHVGNLPAGPDVRVAAVDAVAAARVEQQITGQDRLRDYHYWAGRPAASCVVVSVDGSDLGVGAVGGEQEGYGLAHFVSDAAGPEPLLGVLAALGGRARVTVPGPHPVLPVLLGAGWRVEDTDIYMSTDGSLLDPARVCPNPALA
jgi:GNAT superfamily N-acetyltransferase